MGLNNDAFQLDVITVARLLGIVVPLLVAAITKRYASPGVKGLCNLVLSVIGGAIAPVLTGDASHMGVGEFFNSIMNTFAISVVSYYGVLKHTIAPVIADATATVGLGSNGDAAAPVSGS